jgi:D-tyrosyl-tRNA(Tyr) deacylase
MRAVVQRVLTASVAVEGRVVGEIGPGLLVLLGVSTSDARTDADYLAEKIAGLRIFEDVDGKMNLSVTDVGGAVLAVSQFTLYGDVRRGKRPSPLTTPPVQSEPASCMSTSSLRFSDAACTARRANSKP